MKSIKIFPLFLLLILSMLIGGVALLNYYQRTKREGQIEDLNNLTRYYLGLVSTNSQISTEALMDAFIRQGGSLHFPPGEDHIYKIVFRPPPDNTNEPLPTQILIEAVHKNKGKILVLKSLGDGSITTDPREASKAVAHP